MPKNPLPNCQSNLYLIRYIQYGGRLGHYFLAKRASKKIVLVAVVTSSICDVEVPSFVVFAVFVFAPISAV